MSTAAPDGRAPHATQAGIMAPDRGSLYVSARNGHLFRITGVAGGGSVTGKTSYLVTTPDLVLTRSSSATKRLILSSATFSQKGTVAGGVITIYGMMDNTAPAITGGTARTPANMIHGAAAATTQPEQDRTMDNVTFKDGVTSLGAFSAGPRCFLDLAVAASIGSVTSIDFKDGVILQKGAGALAFYLYAAATAPTFSYMLDFIEE